MAVVFVGIVIGEAEQKNLPRRQAIASGVEDEKTGADLSQRLLSGRGNVVRAPVDFQRGKSSRRVAGNHFLCGLINRVENGEWARRPPGVVISRASPARAGIEILGQGRNRAAAENRTFCGPLRTAIGVIDHGKGCWVVAYRIHLRQGADENGSVIGRDQCVVACRVGRCRGQNLPRVAVDGFDHDAASRLPGCGRIVQPRLGAADSDRHQIKRDLAAHGCRWKSAAARINAASSSVIATAAAASAGRQSQSQKQAGRCILQKLHRVTSQDFRGSHQPASKQTSPGKTTIIVPALSSLTLPGSCQCRRLALHPSCPRGILATLPGQLCGQRVF